jgi:hypothetical protein
MKKQNKKQQEDEKILLETENAISLGEQLFQILLPRNSRYDDIESKELSQVAKRKIEKRVEQISDMDSKKEELILNIIGKLHEGVLIPEKLTARNGKIYEYRKQQHAELSAIKELFYPNKAIIQKKLPQSSVDVLEFVLQKCKTNENGRTKMVKFDELKILEIEKDNEDLDLNLVKTNGFVIDGEGDVKFIYQYPKGEIADVSPETKIYNGLFLKFKKEIKTNAELFLQELDTDIQNFNKEMDEIKEKGQNQLALIELESTSEDKEDEDN